MALIDIYQVVHSGTLKGERIQNVYFYRTGTGEFTALDLAAAFLEDIETKLTNWLSVNVVFTGTRVINLGSFTDFAATASSTACVAAGNMLPAECALNITMRLNTREIRPGSKRYSGILAGITTDGIITNGGTITAIEALMGALASPISKSSGGTGSYIPVVVKRVKETDEETGKVSYRLPVTTEELVVGDVIGCLTSLDVSTQKTRDNGR